MIPSLLTRAGARRRWGFVVLAAALAFLGSSVGLWGGNRAQAVDAFGLEGDCRFPVAHDFAEPLDGLPKLRSLPEPGELSVLPDGVRLEFLASEVAVSPAIAGVSLEAFDRTESAKANVSISTRLGRVDRSTGSVKELASVRKVYRVISAKERSQLEPGGRLGVGIYRLLVFIRRSGQVLGRYGQYFRVVKGTRRAHLVASPASVDHGRPVTFHFENFGSLPLEFGLPYRIEHWSEGSWRPAPGGPSGPWPEVLLAIAGGGASGCSSWDIPTDAVPGLYRAAHRVTVGGKSEILTAPFRVVGGD